MVDKCIPSFLNIKWLKLFTLFFCFFFWDVKFCICNKLGRY